MLIPLISYVLDRLPFGNSLYFCLLRPSITR